MPSYKVHLIGGAVVFAMTHHIATTLSFLHDFSSLQLLLVFGVTLIGSLFPDIDVTSRIRQLFYMALIPCLPIAYFFNIRLFFVLSTITLIMLFLRHRGVTHTVWFLAFIPSALAGLYILKNPDFWHFYAFTGFCFFAGALSHIALDYFVSHIIMRK